MRIISFCADDIKKAAKNGFYEWATEQDAEFICIQNLNAHEHELNGDVFFPENYNAYFWDAIENNNGVAIYSKALPKAIMHGLGFEKYDMEGRYIQADFENLSVGCLLAPFAKTGDSAAIGNKTAFFELYQSHLEKVRNKRREFIICGNFNIAHQARDLQAAEDHNDSAGFLIEERRWFDKIFKDLGYIDAFREINSDDDEFSWWPSNNRNNDGWRVDYQIVSAGLRHKIEHGALYRNREFSAHAPLIIDYELELNID